MKICTICGEAKELMVMTFTVRPDHKGRGWMVIRVGGEYSQHSHHKSRSSCYRLIGIIKAGILPRSGYLIESARRLLTPDEYAKLKRCKEKYINSPRR